VCPTIVTKFRGRPTGVGAGEAQVAEMKSILLKVTVPVRESRRPRPTTDGEALGGSELRGSRPAGPDRPGAPVAVTVTPTQLLRLA
jgi:hypothetical protein